MAVLIVTPVEKIAGSKFRDGAQAALSETFDTNPPNAIVPNAMGIMYMHECPHKDGARTAIDIKEVRVKSPALWVFDTEPPEVVDADDPVAPAKALMSETTVVPAGRFGFVYRQGTCKSCEFTVRSATGRLVDAWERAPGSRVARR